MTISNSGVQDTYVFKLLSFFNQNSYAYDKCVLLEPSSWAMILDLIREFGRQTSIKGIPRLLRTKSTFMKVTWAVSILCFIAMAVWQAAELTINYMEHSSVTAIHEIPLDPNSAMFDDVVMPDLTFCNVNPFSSNFTNASDILTIEEFIHQVTEMTSCINCSETEEKSMSRLRDELITTRGYHTQIGKDNAQRISHKKEALIASCHIWLNSGTHNGNTPCDSSIIVEKHHTVPLFNCYTFKAPLHLPYRLYNGIILVFHLDNYGINNYPHALPFSANLGYLEGMVFAIHQKGQVPNVIEVDNLLQAGVFSNYKIRLQKRIRLSKPYGECVRRGAGHNEYLTNVTYDKVICYLYCQRALILDMCGCIDVGSYLDDLAVSDKRPCLKLDLGQEQLLKEWRCLQIARNTSGLRCTEACPLPCEETTFQHQVDIQSTPSFISYAT